MDANIFCQLFKGLVRPHLEYAQAVWSPKSKTLIKKIEEVQKRATKLIPGFYNLFYQDRLKKLKLPTLAYRRARWDMIEIYKMLAERGAMTRHYHAYSPNLAHYIIDQATGATPNRYTIMGQKITSYVTASHIVSKTFGTTSWMRL